MAAVGYVRSEVCAYCNKTKEQLAEIDEKLKKCARCRLDYYCSVACQRADWPKHKPVCLIDSRHKPIIPSPTDSERKEPPPECVGPDDEFWDNGGTGL